MWMTVMIVKRPTVFLIIICLLFSIAMGAESLNGGVPSNDTGLYLTSQEAPYDGHVRAVNACAFLTETDPNPQGFEEITLYFRLADYRLIGSSFKRITETVFFVIIIQRTDRFGCNVMNVANEIRKGDRAGVFIEQESCGPLTILGQDRYFCPAHVNIIDPVKNCSQSLYFSNAELEPGNVMPAELNAFDGYPVDVFINLELVIEPDFTQNTEELTENDTICATGFNNVIKSNDIVSNDIVIVIMLPIVISAGILISIFIIGVVLYCYKRKVKRLKENDAMNTISNDNAVDLQYNAPYNQLVAETLNTEHTGTSSHLLVESQHSYVINSLEEVNNTESANEELYWQPASKEEDLKQQLKKLKVDEVLEESISLKEYLGSGQFGIVYRGLLTVTGVDSVDSGGGVKEVAVKTMENGASEEQRIKFLQEAAIMGQFNNPYVIKIYGVLTSIHPYMIICELMNKGDLHRHLHTIKISGTLNQHKVGALLLSYSRQVASAMVYLSDKGYIHRDLATRNILLSMDGVCKISDFGLSRNLQDEAYYVAQSGLIPLRWTAPEALQDGKFSTASDIWSFGIVLYEIWSLASKPYGSLSNEQVMSKVAAGHRLPSPPGCPRAIYHKMISCWHPHAVNRPTFNELQISLQQPDYELLKWSEEDKLIYVENARTIGATFKDGEILFADMQRMYETP